jgi:tRNA (cmo5U34)-methyltransferase
MKTTNVESKDLNYDKYENDKYDQDIVRVIPGHKELHKKIEQVVKEFSQEKKIQMILDLGVGTGLTSEIIMKIVPNSLLVGVDFSEKMLSGAEKRLSKYKTKLLLGDYSQIVLGNKFDIIVSVIGIHHQNNEGKKNTFKKIFDSLNSEGLFIFGDLVTFRDKYEVALNEAKHYAFLVQNAQNEQSLSEWTYHHKFLNDLAPLEDQVQWLKGIGFTSVEVVFRKFNTALIIAKK